MPNLIIGSRGSKLALWQANWVKSRLEKAHSGLTVEIEIIKTTGDKLTEASLVQIGGKGVFTKEIEDALLERRIDLAVHSLKDLPTTLPAGLQIAAITEREDVRDALLVSEALRGKVETIKDLPQGARVGTSSLRRRAQLLYQRPDLQIHELRGNVDTRLRKLNEGEYDAIILASAGLIRLGFSDRIAARIDVNEMLTAVGQGALGIETRVEDQQTNLFIDVLNHWPTRHSAEAERTLLQKLGGGCAVPIAALGRIRKDKSDGKKTVKLFLDALVADAEGGRLIRQQVSGSINQAQELGAQLAQSLIKAGARELLPRIGGTEENEETRTDAQNPDSTSAPPASNDPPQGETLNLTESPEQISVSEPPNPTEIPAEIPAETQAETSAETPEQVPEAQEQISVSETPNSTEAPEQVAEGPEQVSISETSPPVEAEAQVAEALEQISISETSESSNSTEAPEQTSVGETGESSNFTDAPEQISAVETGESSSSTEAPEQAAVSEPAASIETEAEAQVAEAAEQVSAGEPENPAAAVAAQVSASESSNSTAAVAQAPELASAIEVETNRTATVQPLSNRRVIITRSIKQSTELTRGLERLGAEVISCPTIEIKEPSSWEQLDLALKHLSWYDWLIFTSANGVEYFLRRLDGLGHGRAELMSHRICAVGRKTAERLKDENIIVDLMPERFTAESVVEDFIKRFGVRQRLRGARMLLPASRITRDVIRPALDKIGIFVEVVEAYQTVLPSTTGAEVAKLICQANADYIVFTSPSTVTNLATLLEADHLAPYLPHTRVACIGPATSETARLHGLEVHIQPEEHTGQAIVAALVTDSSRPRV